MKYRNKLKETIKFRGYDKNGVEKVFELKEGEEMESDRKTVHYGLEEIGEKKPKKKRGEE